MSHVNQWGRGTGLVREHSLEYSYVVVGLIMGGEQRITVDHVRNGTYRDAVGDLEFIVRGGGLSFHKQVNSAGIYVLEGPGNIGEVGVYLR